MRWDRGTDDIPCAESVPEVPLLGFGTWKSQGVHQAHLAAPMPIGPDKQGSDALDLHGVRGARTNA